MPLAGEGFALFRIGRTDFSKTLLFLFFFGFGSELPALQNLPEELGAVRFEGLLEGMGVEASDFPPRLVAATSKEMCW